MTMYLCINTILGKYVGVNSDKVSGKKKEKKASKKLANEKFFYLNCATTL